MLKNKETEQSRELATLQQDLEQRMHIVDEVSAFFFILLDFIYLFLNARQLNMGLLFILFRKRFRATVLASF